MAEEIIKGADTVPEVAPPSKPAAKVQAAKVADRSAARIRLASTLDYPVGIKLADGSSFILDPKGRAELPADALGKTTLPSGVLKQQF